MGRKINMDEVVGACGMYEGVEKYTEGLVRKHERKKALGKH
jgi:hypothetical protein